MNSFELMKKIICCNDDLRTKNVCYFNDIPSKTLSIAVELVALENNLPLSFRIKVISPKNKGKDLDFVCNSLLNMNNSVYYFMIDEVSYKVNVQIYNMIDSGINATQQQEVIFSTVLTVYERK